MKSVVAATGFTVEDKHIKCLRVSEKYGAEYLCKVFPTDDGILTGGIGSHSCVNIDKRVNTDNSDWVG